MSLFSSDVDSEITAWQLDASRSECCVAHTREELEAKLSEVVERGIEVEQFKSMMLTLLQLVEQNWPDGGALMRSYQLHYAERALLRAQLGYAWNVRDYRCQRSLADGTRRS